MTTPRVHEIMPPNTTHGAATLHARDLAIDMRVRCDGDAGSVIWINLATNDCKVAFDDGESAYVHPSDLKRA